MTRTMRGVAAVLLLSLTLPLFAACGGGGEPADTVPAVPSDAETAAAEETTTAAPDSIEARAAVSDGLPDKDFAGADFHMVSQIWTGSDAYVDEETGDVIEDAVYARNRTVEERFNVVLTCQKDTYPNNNAFVQKTILAGEDTIALHFGQGFYSATLVFNDLMQNWGDIPYVDFTREWWAKSTLNDLTYNGICYDAIGDVCLSAMYATYCFFYDKTAAESYGIGDLYGTVADGKWTIDLLAEYIRDIYKDTNGDGQRDFTDYYGLSSDPKTNIDAFQWAFDNPVIKKGNDGRPQIVFHTEKISAIIEKLRELRFNNTGAMISDDYVSPEYKTAEGLSRDMFRSGLCLFANGYVSMAVTHFRDVESDYGIIPMPKWNEAQEEYKSFVDGYHALLQVPVTVQNTEMVGVITEALCAESWKSAIPAYYDVALKVKGARDAESLEMLDLIMDGRTFDFGYIFNTGKGAPRIQALVRDRTQEFESYYASKEEAINTFYEGVFKQYFPE